MYTLSNKFVCFLMLCCCSFLEACAQQHDVTTFIIVRHAEKVSDGTKDPDLSDIGVERAERLSKMLQLTDVAAIYSTSYKRTQNTVAPLARNKGLSVITYEPFDNATLEKMITEHRGKTVVVAGHSNTVPWTINVLTGKEEWPDLKEEEYSNLYIVSVVEKGKTAKVTVLQF